ncbi:hypothetical protein SDC9_168750 [bioreactor metagenome]|uniref:Uncharacterized protein n=1 Tax=bioreactor metagenome TaxID=1076179 RepID=A0A645G3D2_9ZZZZ
MGEYFPNKPFYIFHNKGTIERSYISFIIASGRPYLYGKTGLSNVITNVPGMTIKEITTQGGLRSFTTRNLQNILRKIPKI